MATFAFVFPGQGSQSVGMLDAFIIEEIKRRERVRREQERPAVELPLPAPDEKPRSNRTEEEPEKPSRGVVIIDFASARQAH